MSSVNFENMTKEQKQSFELKRSRYFKSTIAISTIYGAFALGLFLIATVSERGRNLLGTDLMPFTATLLGGMIIIIIFLVVSILNMKPIKQEVYSYDRYACPDYWSLRRLTKNQLNRYDSADRLRMQFKCTPNPRLFTVPTTNDAISAPAGGTLTDAQKKLVEVLSMPTSTQPTKDANGNIISGAINCGEVFPEYLAFHDLKNDPNQPNKLRCEYAKKCNIPWSSACPQ